jgi:LDH2 family malate/lactate/ureidoglycolate dehydrogenase
MTNATVITQGRLRATRPRSDQCDPSVDVINANQPHRPDRAPDISDRKDPMTDHALVSSHWLRDTVHAVFEAAGLQHDAAGRVADSLVSADLRGVPSHGTMLVPMYVERIRRGSVARHSSAEVLVDAGAVAVLDARGALGQVTSDQAMDLAIAKSRLHGVGAVVVRNAFHFGGAFRYVEAAAMSGCIGIAASNTRPLMPAPGGAAAVVGNNPLAVGIPVLDREPLILDMALSEAALGKIRLAAQEGRPIPATWATDSEGAPTTDAAAAIAGLLLPAAGHKGYGLALVIDMLTGVLSGGGFGDAVQGLYADTSVPNNCAHFFLALDIAHFGNVTEFLTRAAQLADQVLTSPTAPGVERTLLPGQLEAERFAAATASGVRVESSVLDALEATARDLDMTWRSPVAATAST